MNKNLQTHSSWESISVKTTALGLSVLVLGILSSVSANATVYYVTTSGNNASAGTSWATAKADLQDAINATSAGDEIWIKEGTYKPTRLPTTGAASTSRDVSFYLDKNIKIYGGFDGTETALINRDIAANPVILSGDIGTTNVSTDNCYHVLITDGLSSAAVIDGLTIQDGVADGTNSITYSGSSFYRSNCGGMYNYVSSPSITNVTFSGNEAVAAAGMYNLYSSPSIINATFSGNEAVNSGGGMYNFSSSPSITNATFSGNEANNGGGIYNQSSSNPTIANSIFWGNKKGISTTVAGADIENSSSTPTVTYCNLQKSYTGTGNITGDPFFVNSADPDGADNVWMTADDGLRLKPNSSSVDVGRNDSVPVGITTDIIGSDRTQNTTVNMGAYEDTLAACQMNSMLPFEPGTYTSSYATADGDTICYCDTFGNLLLALDTTGTGAEIAQDKVSLQIGANIVTKYTTAGGIIANTNGGSIFNRKWNVAATTQPNSDVTVIYPFTDIEYQAIKDTLSAQSTTLTSASELNFYKLTSSGVFADPHASGATGIILLHSTSPSTTNWVYSQHGNGTDHVGTYKVSSFSGGGAGGGAAGAALPVELTYFTVTKQNDDLALLEWQTASELNNEKFDIERQISGTTEFEKVGDIAGAGNSQQLLEYSFIDDISKLSGGICYRIKQLDYDNSSEYSEVECISRLRVSQVLVYPNPVSDLLNIVLLNEQNEYSIQVISLSGVVVKELQSISSIQVDLSDLNEGIYVVQGQAKGGKLFVQKLIIQH